MGNPMSTDTLLPLDLVADFTCRLWRQGQRQPQLSRVVLREFPGLNIEAYNEVASVAWGNLSAAERRAAAEEAGR